MKDVCVHAQLCPILCDPIDCSLPGSSVLGIFQARISEWFTIPIFLPGKCDPTPGILLTQGLNKHLLCLLHFVGRFFTTEPPGQLQNAVPERLSTPHMKHTHCTLPSCSQLAICHCKLIDFITVSTYIIIHCDSSLLQKDR